MIESQLNYQKISELLDNSVRGDDILTALESFISLYKEQKTKKEIPCIPLTLFSRTNLGILETTIKFLKENANLKYCKIAKIINRNERTVWASYNKATAKHQEIFSAKEEEHLIPCNIFSDRKVGPLESITIYLKDNLRLSFKEIAQALNRNYRTIWISYQNGKKKKND